MKRHAKSAYTKLKNMGVPMYIHEGESYHFLIRGVGNIVKVWADFWGMVEGSVGGLEYFGVNGKINKVLNEYDLVCEWQNPGALGVYDA